MRAVVFRATRTVYTLLISRRASRSTPLPVPFPRLEIITGRYERSWSRPLEEGYFDEAREQGLRDL